MARRRRESIWFVSAAHGRPDVTRLALSQRQLACTELKARGFAVASVIVADDENLEIAAQHGCVALEYPNDAVGAKFNAGIRHACEQGADHVVYVGSDDWVHPALFDPLPWDASPGHLGRIITGTQIGFVDLQAGRLSYGLARSVIPWVLPRSVLEPLEFEPVEPTLNRGLDHSLVRRLEEARVAAEWFFHDPFPLARVDFKSTTNITPYERVHRRLGTGPEVEPWWPLVRHYPLELVELAAQTHERARAARDASRRPNRSHFKHRATGEVRAVDAGRVHIFERSPNWKRHGAATAA